MNPVILFRMDRHTEKEFGVAMKYFPITQYRSYVLSNSLVIGRFSVLPFYQELEIDLEKNNSRLINSYEQHCWIANFEWYNVLSEYTFKTWFNAHELPDDKSFVVKGRTNSRKHNWNTLMFAKTKRDAIEIGWQLSQDSLISSQGVVYREYRKLITHEIGINDLPFTHEFRIFCYKDIILSHAYYWSLAENTDIFLDEDGLAFAKKLTSIIKDYVNFYVIDIAKTEDGEWILVEINDGQMSGLSENNADQVYNNLKESL